MKHSFHFSTLVMLVWLLLIAQFAVAQDRPNTPKDSIKSILFPKNPDPLAIAKAIQDILGERAKVVGLSTQEYVQGKKGTWISITYRPSKEERFLYEAGKYIIKDSVRERLDELKQSFYNFLDDEDRIRIKKGGDKKIKFPYELYFLGRADTAGVPTFKDNQSRYGKQYYKVKRHRLDQATGMYEVNATEYDITNEYDNNDLPNLRASYMKDFFAGTKENTSFPVEKLHILEGKVEQAIDAEFRSVTIYLFIDNIEKR